jgi:hypothetical protein
MCPCLLYHEVTNAATVSAGRLWGVYGRSSRVSDLARGLAKQLIVWLTRAVTSVDKMSRIAVISERNNAKTSIRG